MSADLHLYAAPNTEDTRFWARKMDEVDMIGGDIDWEEQALTPEHAEKVGKPVIVTVSSKFYEKIGSHLYGKRWSGPNVWIGQVSWIKASLMLDDGGVRRYVPGSVARVQELTYDAPVLTPGLAKEITVAMNRSNASIYGRREFLHARSPSDLYGPNGPVRKFGPHYIQKCRGSRGVTSGKHVKRFLEQHIGDIILPTSL